MVREFWMVEAHYSVFSEVAEITKCVRDHSQLNATVAALKEMYRFVWVTFHKEKDGVSILPSDLAQ